MPSMRQVRLRKVLLWVGALRRRSGVLMKVLFNNTKND